MKKNIFYAFTLMIISVLCLGAVAACDVNGSSDVEIQELDTVLIDYNNLDAVSIDQVEDNLVDNVSIDEVNTDVVDENTDFKELGDDSSNPISDDNAHWDAVSKENSVFISVASMENCGDENPFSNLTFPHMPPIYAYSIDDLKLVNDEFSCQTLKINGQKIVTIVNFKLQVLNEDIGMPNIKIRAGYLYQEWEKNQYYWDYKFVDLITDKDGYATFELLVNPNDDIYSFYWFYLDDAGFRDKSHSIRGYCHGLW